jgi:hypothetical protein
MYKKKRWGDGMEERSLGDTHTVHEETRDHPTPPPPLALPFFISLCRRSRLPVLGPIHLLKVPRDEGERPSPSLAEDV